MNALDVMKEQLYTLVPQPLVRPLATLTVLAAVGAASGEVTACSTNDGLPPNVTTTHISRTAGPREVIPKDPSLPAANSSIWAGYVASRQATNRYTSVHGSFTIQAIKCDSRDPEAGRESYAQWVGLDGWDGDNTVEQIGVTADCIDTSLTKGDKGVSKDKGSPAPAKPGNLKPKYYAWWMNFGGGSYSRVLDFPVHSGDRMDASVTYKDNNQFEMRLANATTGQVYKKLSTCLVENSGEPCQRTTADWIVERAGNSALANFGLAGFDEAIATTDGTNGEQQTITELSGFPVDMFQAANRLTYTSGLSANGQSFNITYKQHGQPGY